MSTESAWELMDRLRIALFPVQGGGWAALLDPDAELPSDPDHWHGGDFWETYGGAQQFVVAATPEEAIRAAARQVEG